MKTKKKITSLKAMILTGIYDWMIMNSKKIDILIDNKIYQNEYLKEFETSIGMVILNISPAATADFKIDDDGVSFSATFNTVLRQFTIPLCAVIAIKLKEFKDGTFPWYTLPNQKQFDYDDSVNIDLSPTTTTLTVSESGPAVLDSSTGKLIKFIKNDKKENKNNVVNMFDRKDK